MNDKENKFINILKRLTSDLLVVVLLMVSTAYAMSNKIQTNEMKEKKRANIIVNRIQEKKDDNQVVKNNPDNDNTEKQAMDFEAKAHENDKVIDKENNIVTIVKIIYINGGSKPFKMYYVRDKNTKQMKSLSLYDFNFFESLKLLNDRQLMTHI